MTPLLFANFVTALFVSNALTFGLLARAMRRRRNEARTYAASLKEAITTASFRADVVLGLTGAVAFLALLACTLGQSTTSTFSTASTRLLALPFYATLFAVVFTLYASFFKGVARSMIGGGALRMVYAFCFELVILLATFVLELVVITTVISFAMPYMQLGFFLLGLKFLLVALTVSIASGCVTNEQTGSWVIHVTLSALLFATLTVVFSPALSPVG